MAKTSSRKPTQSDRVPVAAQALLSKIERARGRDFCCAFDESNQKIVVRRRHLGRALYSECLLGLWDKSARNEQSPLDLGPASVGERREHGAQPLRPSQRHMVEVQSARHGHPVVGREDDLP